MIIQPIRELYGEDGTRVTANKERVSGIKENISNKEWLGEKFNELVYNLDNEGNKGDLYDRTSRLLSKELYLEVVCKSLIDNLHIAYRGSNNKANFIKELKESYTIRGIKGIVHSWSPVIAKYSA